MGIAHRLRMPLLFVIAGAGMWFALGNRNGGGMVRERSLRLLLPLVAGMLLIVPPQIYFERLFRGQWDGGYLSFFFERVLQLQPYPQGDFSWHHLWFVAYLYVYVFLLLPLLLWWRSAPQGREARRVAVRAGDSAGRQRGAPQAAVSGVARADRRLVHLQSLPPAHAVRLRAGLDARCVGLVRDAPAAVARRSR